MQSHSPTTTKATTVARERAAVARDQVLLRVVDGDGQREHRSKWDVVYEHGLCAMAAEERREDAGVGPMERDTLRAMDGDGDGHGDGQWDEEGDWWLGEDLDIDHLAQGIVTSDDHWPRGDDGGCGCIGGPD